MLGGRMLGGRMRRGKVGGHSLPPVELVATWVLAGHKSGASAPAQTCPDGRCDMLRCAVAVRAPRPCVARAMCSLAARFGPTGTHVRCSHPQAGRMYGRGGGYHSGGEAFAAGWKAGRRGLGGGGVLGAAARTCEAQAAVTVHRMPRATDCAAAAAAYASSKRGARPGPSTTPSTVRSGTACAAQAPWTVSRSASASAACRHARSAVEEPP